MSNNESNLLPRLPTPLVKQAVGKFLTVPTPDGESGITVDVARWRTIEVGQPTTLHICGYNRDGSTMMQLIVDKEPVTQDEYVKGWSRDISWEHFQGLLDRSHLMFVFQVPLENGECGCPDLFPPLSLEIVLRYEDVTTFSAKDGTDNWNGWMRGEAAADPRDLTVRQDGNGYALFSNTFTSRSSGVLLSKSFQDLEVGRVYTFGIDVRRWINLYAVPVLSLESSAGVIVPPTEITSAVNRLEGSFTADSSQMDLEIVSHIATGMGNDYIISKIWLTSL
ncbi:sugar-binding protein [Pseudomonas sp. FW300-N2A2]|uniref:sugar-binding protein n=1 Tax=Pseudomonas sp. FW300-N2A2 TaxID=2751316 RepID=UPI001A90EDDA|nr:sugar-binding protein [Pseudomonas sp. FW300-N2A2]